MMPAIAAATSHSSGPGEVCQGRPLVASLATALVLTGQGLLVLLAVLLFLRWLGGAHSQPAPAAAILATAVVVSAIAIAYRAWLVHSASYRIVNADFCRAALFAVPAVSSLLILAALAVRGASPVAIVLAWLIVAAS